MKVKICGFTTSEEALFAAQAGADFIGLVFYEKSKRRIGREEALDIVKEIEKTSAQPVAVFVDADADEMISYCRELGIKYAQLHGVLSKREGRKLPDDIARIYAIQVVEGKCEEEDLSFLDPKRDFLLFDGKNPGSGESLEWEKFVLPPNFRCFLAGGLKIENLTKALGTCPYGVDVSSGVEKITGIKDRELMKNFLMKAKKEGYYGPFGGAFIPEILAEVMEELKINFDKLKKDPSFMQEFLGLLKNYGGRPTALTEVNRFAEAIGAPRIFLKREDLLHTGAHKLNNALGQCLLAKVLGKTRIIAETGAGQHGVATATACAKLGLGCVIYMGKKDIERQKPNVIRMQLLGATVIEVESGSQTLKDAVNEALRDWSQSYATTHYCLGSALGPHPFPEMVAFFQSVIGKETKEQFFQKFGRDPDLIVACVGGGSNAIGIFSAYLDAPNVRLVGVEAGGSKEGHAARFQGGTPGILHGNHTYILQDEHGQILPTHSISAGLDYPAVWPQDFELFLIKRA